MDTTHIDTQDTVEDQTDVQPVTSEPEPRKVEKTAEQFAWERQKQREKELKEELEKTRKERDEALAKASTADEAKAVEGRSNAELLKVDVLADNGLQPSLREFINATDKEGIQAQIDKLKSQFPAPAPTVAAPIAPEPQAPEPEKQKPAPSAPDRPAPATSTVAPDVSKMTPEQQRDYYADQIKHQV